MQLVKENKMAVHINHPRFTKKDKRKLGLLMIVVGLALIIGAFFLKRWEDRTYTMEGNWNLPMEKPVRLFIMVKST
jgi:uncharacterized membrane protein YidH (DUF202 family)